MSSAAARVQWRFRLLACCLALTALAFIQAPGRTIADTKLDLVVNPGGFLSRALDLWDPQSSFGQVQNQAYGYFFPMGPFFWLGDAVDLDPWVVQRLWWALLFVVAFLGMVKLARELGITSQLACLLAGFAYALSPRILSVIGPSSVEVWPSAVAPWVLIPLVIGTRRGHPVRMAALSALAVMCVGGVNAAATFAVIPLGVLWLLTAERGARRRRLMMWWPPLVALASMWWLIPLFLLGKYSPPFLDYIESASITTVAATPFDALRGTTNWVSYISTASVAGNQLISQPVLILNGVVVLALGLCGLAMCETPHRAFLLCGLFLGLVLVTAGHTGAIDGLGSGSVQQALDGVLAPLRNTHKFDIVLRIPLVLGLAFAVSTLTRRAKEADAVRAVGMGVLVVAGVVGATVPAWSGQLANKGSFEQLPDYWRQASSWLGDNANGTALLAPASAFPNYIWGSTGDEPIQPLAHSPWAVRNSIPLANGGTIRFLDAVNATLSQGSSATGLAATLRRAGVEYLVVRNDLDTGATGATAELTYRSLEDSEGITSVASFGPTVGSDPSFDSGSSRSFANGGWQAQHPAVEIFKVSGRATTYIQSVKETPTVVGSADSLALLDSLGLTDGRSVLLAPDLPGEIYPSPLIMTDGNRRQEVAFGSVNGNRSGSLAPDEEFTANRRVHDYADGADDDWLAIPKMIGASSLASSGSRDSISTIGGTRPLDQAWSAFDGDVRSAWRTTGSSGWIRLDLGKKKDLGEITIRSDQPPGVEQTISMSTERGPSTIVTSGRAPKTVEIGSVAALDMKVDSSDGDVAIAEIAGPQLEVSRTLQLPSLRVGWAAPDSIVLGDDGVDRPGCLKVAGIDRCRADFAEWGEDGVVIDRSLTLSTSADYAPRIRIAPIGGEPLDRFLQRGESARVSSSSQINRDPRASVTRALDRDLKTGWIAESGDKDPSITWTWDDAQKLDELHLTTSAALPASVPSSAVLAFGDGTQQRVQFRDGVAEFDEVTTDSVTVHLDAAVTSSSFDSAGIAETVPVGVSEMWFGPQGKYSVEPSEQTITIPCGQGPSFVINGQQFQTEVSTSEEDVARGIPADAVLCGDERVTLPADDSRIVIKASELFRATSVVLEQDRDTEQILAEPVDRRDASSTERKVDVPASDQETFLQMGENLNPGWTARLGATELKPLQVNGWQQGWRLPPHAAGTVELSYEPNSIYRGGLAVGALCALIVLFLAWRRRPFAASAWVPTPSRSRTVAFAGLTLAATLLVGGPLFAAAALFGAAAGWLAERTIGQATWLAAVPMALAALIYVIRPWGGSSDWAGTMTIPQICVALALGIVAVTFFSDRQDLSLRKGSSTSR